MASSNFGAYRVDNDDRVNESRWNRVFKDVDQRLLSLEVLRDAVDVAINELKAFGLERIDSTLTPSIEQAQQAVSDLQVLVDELLTSGSLPAGQVAIAEIAGLTGTNAQAALEDVQAQLDAIGGNVPSHIVADTTERDALTGLEVGDVVHVQDNGGGAGEWAQYRIIAAGDGTWGGATATLTTSKATSDDIAALESDVIALDAELDTKAHVSGSNLTGRLGVSASIISSGDWNTDAVTNGWFMGSNVANAPLGSNTWFLGYVVRHNNLWLVQHVWDFSGLRKHYERHLNNSTWGSWVQVSAGDGAVWHADNPASQAEAEAGANNTKGMTPLRVSQAIAALASGGSAPDVIIEDQKTQNSDGGSFSNGADRTRDLNTLVYNEGSLASLSANQFTLPAGTYYIQWTAPSYKVQSSQSFLYNVTDSSEVARGSQEPGSSSSSYNHAKSIGSVVVTIGASKAFEIRHRCQTTRSSDGFGKSGNFGTEVFTRVEIWKV